MTDTQDLLERKKLLEGRLQTWQTKAAVAESNVKRLKEEIAAALSTLKTQYGCDSYEDAVKLRDTLTAKTEEKFAQLEKVLDALDQQ